MLSETLAALAGASGSAVVQAMVGDSWESAKGQLARLMGRGNPEGTAAAEERLERSRAELMGLTEQELPGAEKAQVAVWRERLAELLEEHPQIEVELRDWVARIGCGNDTITTLGRQQPILGSGVQINKFFDRREHEEVAPTISPPIGRRYDQPPLRGREKLINELVAMQSAAEDRVHVLQGLGGSGKSTVALEVADRIKDLGVEVWWVPATHTDRVTMGMLTLGRRLGLSDAQIRQGDVADLVWQCLADREDPWLLIFDNADDLNVFSVDGAPVPDGTGWIRPVLSAFGMVIVTSRHGLPSDWGGWCHLHPVGMLSPSDGAQVLIDNAGTGAGDRPAATALSKRLGGLPLALRLAASYLAQAQEVPAAFISEDCIRTFAQYQSAVNGGRFDEVFPAQQRVALSDRQARQMIGRTWELSLDLLERRDVAMARPLLRLLACLADAPIPYELLLRPAALVESGLVPASMTGVELWEALRALAGTGLVELNESSSDTDIAVLRLHPLVRDTSQPRENKEHYLTTAAALLSEAAHNADSGLPEQPAMWPIWQLLVSHALGLLDMFRDVPDGSQQAWRDATEAAYLSARYLAATGAYRPAKSAYTEVFVARERVLGPDHPDTLRARYGLARIAAAQGRYSEAETTYRNILAVEERMLGKDHPDTLRARYGLARMAGEQGRHDEAKDMYRALLAVQKRISADSQQADRVEATWEDGEEEHSGVYREVLAVEERVSGTDHPDYLTARYVIARTAAAQGRYDEAETAYREVFAIEKSMLGADHPDTLTTGHWIARMAIAQRKYTEAETLFRAVLVARERILGADHPHTLTTRYWAARAAHAQGKKDAAEADLRHVLAERKRVLGPRHPRTRQTQQTLREFQTHRR